ncbi:hypothetical protein [Gordonia sp. NPDC003950]
MDTPSPPSEPDVAVPRWLRITMRSDRAWSSWYIVASLFFAPILLWLDTWPVLRTVAVMVIAVSGLWLGLLGIAMATGLAIVLHSGAELPEQYWRTVFHDLPPTGQSANAAATDSSSSP